MPIYSNVLKCFGLIIILFITSSTPKCSSSFGKHETIMAPENIKREQGKTRIKHSVFLVKSNKTRSIVSYATSAPKPSDILNKPRFLNTQSANLKFDSKAYLCSKDDSNEKCAENTRMHKIRVLNEFRRVLTFNAHPLRQESNSSNPYNVSYKMDSNSLVNQSRDQLLCDLQAVRIKTIAYGDHPFNNMEIGKWFPKYKLFENKIYNSCAIIASAGSLLGSGLGKFIDSHEIVLRFNHAPTKGYEEDVGSKTTIRIVNSQVMTQERFKFPSSELYRGKASLLGWDPSSQGASLSSWASAPEHDLFTAYTKYMQEDKLRPEGGFYLLHPETLWTLWEFIQRRTLWKLRRNPPSSGFLGISLLLPHCETLRIMEYIPSARLSARCHYFSPTLDPACTFGAWHPLAAEKLLALEMNQANDYEVFQRGYITLKPTTC